MMQIKNDVSLKQHSTMRLGGKAKYLLEVTDKHELVACLAWAKDKKVPLIMIGSGSNIVWRDEGFDGLVIVNKIGGFELTKEDNEYTYVTVGSGELWDSVVKRTVKAGLHGIEALSLIPGLAGATPVQNVGAYGQDVAQTLVSLEAYDRDNECYVTLETEACNFGYRTSRFKEEDKGRFLITSLTFRLRRINPRPPFYPSVAVYFRDHHVHVVTPKILREAVIDIRTSKLPDPAKVANNGSFFSNPIIPAKTYRQLAKEYPKMPHWPAGTTKVKVPAAWLLEEAGFKDVQDKKTGMATWPAQPLVLVNQHAKKTTDLLTFRDSILKTVYKKFGIHLEQEPELI